MPEDIKSKEELEELMGQNAIRSVNILFLDISSTCTGYAIAAVDFHDKTVKWKHAGALWLNPDWEHAEKYLYMHEAIVNYFWIVGQTDFICVEQYSFNKNKMMGVQVVPEMQGAIKCAAQANGVKVASILPQSWRKQLEIKAVITKDKNGKNKRDYKTPTKDKIKEYLDIPAKSVSNITKKERQTPSDLYDAMGVGLGWLKRLGFEKNDFSEIEFNAHIQGGL